MKVVFAWSREILCYIEGTCSYMFTEYYQVHGVLFGRRRLRKSIDLGSVRFAG